MENLPSPNSQASVTSCHHCGPASQRPSNTHSTITRQAIHPPQHPGTLIILGGKFCFQRPSKPTVLLMGVSAFLETEFEDDFFHKFVPSIGTHGETLGHGNLEATALHVGPPVLRMLRDLGGAPACDSVKKRGTAHFLGTARAKIAERSRTTPSSRKNPITHGGSGACRRARQRDVWKVGGPIAHDLASWAALNCLGQFSPGFIGLVTTGMAQNVGRPRIQ